MTRHISNYPGDAADLAAVIRTTATCPECARRFDLTDDDDAAEWAYGHDCEA